MNRPPPRLLLAGLALPCVACLPFNETIEGTDASTFFPGARVSYLLTEPATPGDGAKPVEAMIDLDLGSSRSEFTQQVAAGEGIEVDGRRFAGPQDVDVSFDLLLISADFRGSLRSPSGLGIEAVLGMGWASLELGLSTPGHSADGRLEGWGPLIGLALFYEPVDRLRLYVEGRTHPLIPTATIDLVRINTLDIGASVRLARHVALRASWREVNYSAENDSFHSDLELRASGPALSLGLSW